MGWFSDFRWFIRDMYRQWVGKMTATLSIILAVAPLVFPEFFAGDKGLLRAQWVWWSASAAAFLVAARSAWGEERSKRLSAEEKLSQVVKALEDNTPKLSLSANGVEGPKEWRESPVPLAFTIHHLSGRVPTSLYFDPIPSKNGKFLLQLNSLPHVSQNRFEGLGFDIVEVGAPALSAADRETTKRYIHKELLNMFLNDCPQQLLEMDYEATVHFKDGEVDRTQSFRIAFDKTRFKVQCGPSIPKLPSASDAQTPGLPATAGEHPETEYDF